MNVLIADDEAVSRTLLSSRLRHWGHKVICVDNGTRAWDVLRNDKSISIAILDWMMPEVDGLDVCARFRKAFPERNLYIILVTSKSNISDLAVALETGANDFIPKPCHMSELHARLGVASRTVELHNKLEKALRTAEATSARYESLVELAHDLFLTIDKSGTVVSANAAAERITGYNKAELLGVDVNGFLPDPELRRQIMHEFFRKKNSLRCEFNIAHKDGRVISLDTSLQPIIENNAFTGARIIGRDITARKAAERELAATVGNMKGLLEGAPVAIISLDANCIVRTWNPAAQEALGWTPEEVLGKALSSFASPEIVKEAELALHAEQGFKGRRAMLHRKDQSTVPASVSVAIMRGSDGKVAGLIASLLDLTELRQVEEKYRTLVQGAVLGVFQTSGDGWIISGNPALAKLLGYESVDELLKININDTYINQEERQTYRQEIERHGFVTSFEFQIQRRDKKPIWVSENSRVVRNAAGEIVCFEGTLQDITERKTLEEQLRQAQKLEAVGRLSGGIAHDFNNILMIIESYTELLGSIVCDQQCQPFISEISRAAERGAGLTKQLLAFSRKQMLSPQVLDMNSVIASSISMLKRLIGEDIRLSIEPSPSRASVRLDKVQFEQVLINLAINARDAMPSGGVIKIRLHDEVLTESQRSQYPDLALGDYVCLTVADNGSGIDEGIMNRIFEPFFTTKEPGLGTGLGLATVYGIIQQSGGFIEVSSTKGLGTAFNIYMPKVEPAAVVNDQNIPTVAVSFNFATILLVEDEDALRDAAATYLRSCGYLVMTARNAFEAIETAKRNSEEIDLIVTDVVMPGQSGISMVEEIRKMVPGIRAIFMSGYSFDMLRNHGVSEEMVLQKPFSLQRLRDTVSGICANNIQQDSSSQASTAPRVSQ